MTSGRILVVDDDRAGRLSLAEILRLEGYSVEMAESGEAAVSLLRSADCPYDLMLLDLKMPGMDGMAVLEAARETAPDTQIIFLTAHGSLESAIAALRHGAHDYLIKPSPTGDIIASVQRGLERRRAESRRRRLLDSLESSLRELRGGEAFSIPPGERGGEARFEIDGIGLDLAAHQLIVEGKAVELTPTELKLMACLMRQPGAVVKHAQIVREVHGYPASSYEAAEIVRPVVSRLRRKLAEVPGAEACVVTVKGTGYRFVGKAKDNDRHSPNTN
ncbi:MAG: response regulator transcription factor [Chloroflexi bacterium]|nr:response regulator transcription factor [Chloroflexota bacterium]MBI3764855.1 response regulator transcription factor [Chloroflexota bacterium]